MVFSWNILFFLLILVAIISYQTVFVNAQTFPSPLKQLKSGILVPDMKCNTGFMLIFKAHDGSPACVHPETFVRLFHYGWITRENFEMLHPVSLGIPINNKTMSVTDVIKNIDSLYNKTISVYGTYSYSYPFPLPELPCRSYLNSSVIPSPIYDNSNYVPSHSGAHFLVTGGDVLEIIIMYPPTNTTILNVPNQWVGLPMILNGTLQKQYIGFCGGSDENVLYKSAYLVVKQNYLKESS